MIVGKKPLCLFDMRREIYALGAVFHFLYTGSSLLPSSDGSTKGMSYEEQLQFIADGLARPLKAPNDIQIPKLMEIISRALAFSPEDRFHTVLQLHEAIKMISNNL